MRGRKKSAAVVVSFVFPQYDIDPYYLKLNESDDPAAMHYYDCVKPFVIHVT